MNTAEQKTDQQVLADFEAQKKDFAFFERGVPFSEVRVCSAKALFGGNWKTSVKNYLGDETLQMFAERSEGEKGKLIDFPLAAFNVGDKVGLFSKGEKISVICEDKKCPYNGTYEILATEETFVIILKGNEGNAKGTVINQSRKNGARKAFEKTAKRLSGVEGNGAGAAADVKPENGKDNGKDNKKAKPKRYVAAWLFLIAALLLIFIFSQKQS